MTDNNDFRLTSVGRIINSLCKGLALGGGLVLFLLSVMTVISVAGRFLFDTPIPGDFELIEIGCSAAVFAFLPYCHLHGGNIMVDVVTMKLSRSWQLRLESFGSLVFAVIATILVWRMYIGGVDMKGSGEETMVLMIPRWWGFPFIIPSLGLLVIVTYYVSYRKFVESRR
ncbi:MAG: TRAP transporter small permease [Alphaproteobacteria bacterium]|nr:TRAP transporter small permease [Rhodospirillales bacterium]MCW9044947.1 TRAP transporter small permease [Alphaproteobacteria bacterium]